ncbi:MAG: hypothetical protein JKY51_04215 [Opitutaceae bacterium]|nr:hypothetical protein [Opitutaceae bacterium]
MIPDTLPRNMWIIYLTGALEIAGAMGLIFTRTRKMAALGLILLLGLMFPANVYAALNGVSFQEGSPTSLWLRIPVQVIYISALIWSSVRASVEGYKGYELGDL